VSPSDRVEIREDYQGFVAPAWVRNAIHRLVDGVSPDYLGGLAAVCLVNSGGFNRSRRREKTISRKRKVSVRDCLGLYHQAWHDRPATIELFVDNILEKKPIPAILLRLDFFQDMILSGLLYHELGHHIHKTMAPEHKEREDVAETWKRRLRGSYLRRKYWYLTPIAVSVNWMLTFGKRNKQQKDQNGERTRH
jgi:hypothetical protein